MSPRFALLLLPLTLAACGGLTEEERRTAMGGAAVPDAGAAERAAWTAAVTDPAADDPDTDDPAADADNDSAQADQQD